MGTTAAPMIESACPQISGLYLVCDGSHSITPGILCREFMYEHLPHDMPIIMVRSVALRRQWRSLQRALAYTA